jgi:hypothetical protein
VKRRAESSKIIVESGRAIAYDRVIPWRMRYALTPGLRRAGVVPRADPADHIRSVTVVAFRGDGARRGRIVLSTLARQLQDKNQEVLSHWDQRQRLIYRGINKSNRAKLTPFCPQKSIL